MMLVVVLVVVSWYEGCRRGKDGHHGDDSHDGNVSLYDGKRYMAVQQRNV